MSTVKAKMTDHFPSGKSASTPSSGKRPAESSVSPAGVDDRSSAGAGGGHARRKKRRRLMDGKTVMDGVYGPMKLPAAAWAIIDVSANGGESVWWGGWPAPRPRCGASLPHTLVDRRHLPHACPNGADF